MSHYHLIGIGGIGMSALAHLLLDEGHTVSGSDAKESSSLKQLQKKGARVTPYHDAENITEGTVVYSSAIDPKNPELVRAKKWGLKTLHRSDLLGELLKQKKALQVTGTHGKTTTTALLSHVLMVANEDPSYAIGGHLQTLNMNGRKGTGRYFVVEADESDGSFIKSPSYGAIVTNCGKDHLSYWKTEMNLQEGFLTFFSNVERDLFWCKDDKNLSALNPPGFSYGFSEDADLRVHSFSQNKDGCNFSLCFQGKEYKEIFLPLYGKHNVLNAAGVFGLTLRLSIDEAKIRKGLSSFLGVRRRLEKKGEKHGVVCFDDYAHHPTEIKNTLSALSSFAYERRIVVLFQPHRVTRTQDFWKEFGPSLREADLVFITDIFDAGEAPINGITSQKLADEIGANYLPKKDLVKMLGKTLRPFDIFITIGAGDITEFGLPILEEVEKVSFKYSLGVLSGGVSGEHEISRISAKNMIEKVERRFFKVNEFVISKQGFWGDSKKQKIPFERLTQLLECDVVLPALHGPRGEDGMVQGFLETLGIPYIGCDYRAACLCMNKAWVKHVARDNNVPVAPFLELKEEEYFKRPKEFLTEVIERFSFPIWSKPSHLGSSIGIGKAQSIQELQENIEAGFHLDDSLIIEKHISGREVEFAVLGNKVIRFGEPCIIKTFGEFYDYEKKYGPNGFDVEVPANISSVEEKLGLELAEKVYRSAGCSGLARVDFFLDESGAFYFNEINPFPGFASISGYPKMWEKKGISQQELINELVILALRKHQW